MQGKTVKILSIIVCIALICGLAYFVFPALLAGLAPFVIAYFLSLALEPLIRLLLLTVLSVVLDVRLNTIG